MPDLTVVIPFHTGTPAELLEETLASVLECRPDGLQILVVNAGQYSDSYSIQEEGVSFLSADPDAGLVDCVKLALSEADAPVVQILQCGVVVTEGWVARALASFQRDDVAVMVPLIEEPASGDEVICHTGWVYRPNGTISAANATANVEGVLAPTRFSAFFRRDILIEQNWPSAIPTDFAMIDVTLQARAIGLNVVYDGNVRMELHDVAEEPVDLFNFWKYSEFLFCRWFSCFHPVGSPALVMDRGSFFWQGVRFLLTGKFSLWLRARGEGKNLARLSPVQPVLERVQQVVGQ